MTKPARPKALDAALAYLRAWARRAASLGSGERKRVSVVATPTPKLKVTIDTDSANVERILTALGQVESDPDTVALTGQGVGGRAMSSYQPTTITLSRPEPDVGAAETAFLAAALSGAPSPKQARDKLRLLYVHRHGSCPGSGGKRKGAFFRLVQLTINPPPGKAATGGTLHGQRYQGTRRIA
jgi:hypothetical protein